MLRGVIRRVETTTVEVAGEGLPELQEKLEAACPEGFVLVSAPVSMTKGSTAVTAVGTYARRDGLQEIEADTRDEVLAQVPDGWQLLYTLTDH